MTFAEKLVRLRKIKGLTQDEFASAIGVSRQAVYKWECGKSYPEVPKLLEIKNLFTVSIDDLLDESFEIELPQKKKRRRISAEAKKQIEAQVRAEFYSEKEEATTLVEEIEETLPENEPAVVSAPVEEPVAKEPEVKEKKRGFFKFFGRK